MGPPPVTTKPVLINTKITTGSNDAANYTELGFAERL